MTEAGKRRERIREEAADWIVCLSDSATEFDRVAFEAWRAESIDHEIIYRRELAAWERLDRLTALRPAHGAPDPDILAPRYPSRTIHSPPLRWIALAASIVLLIGVSSIVGLSLTASQAYATAIGERRLVALTDGTTIELNTDSKIEVKYGRSTRSVRLIKGEAVFHIVKDRRPFRLRTPLTTLDAQTAELTVRLIDKDARIAVIAGLVRAHDKDITRPPAITLRGGAEALVGARGTQVHEVTRDEVNRLLAWRQGGVALHGRSLAEAAEEFNRYNSHKILVADEATGAVRVGGYFQTSDINGFVTAVTQTFPIDATRDDRGEIRLSERP